MKKQIDWRDITNGLFYLAVMAGVISGILGVPFIYSLAGVAIIVIVHMLKSNS